MADGLSSKVLTAFQQWDTGRTGCISANSLRHVISGITEVSENNKAKALEPKHVSHLLNTVGVNDSGDLDYQAFCNYVFSMQSSQSPEPSPKFMELVQKILEFDHGSSQKAFRELVDGLVGEHRRALHQASKSTDVSSTRPRRSKERPAPMNIRKSFTDCLSKAEGRMSPGTSKPGSKAWGDNEQEALWQLAKSERHTNGGPKHVELEKQADLLRLNNEEIGEQASAIKKKLKESEAELIPLMEELNPIVAVKSAEGDALQSKITEIVQSMESADLELVDLRREEMRNLEAIRTLKIKVWKLIQDDRLESMVQAAEKAMRKRKGSWFGGRKHSQLRALHDELKVLNRTLAQEAKDTLQQALCLVAAADEGETQLESMPQGDPWLTVDASEDVLGAMQTNNFELQLEIWRLSHLMARKTAVLKTLEKLRRTETFLMRQSLIEQFMKTSSDESMYRSELEKLDLRTKNINEETNRTKLEIGNLLSEADVKREQLVALRHVQNNEASAKRDQLLMLTNTVMYQDTRLAWLRKDQLQTMELAGLLRERLSSLSSTWNQELPLIM